MVYYTISAERITFCGILYYRGADKSLTRPGKKQARKHVRDARFQQHRDASCHQVLFFLQGKALKEIHAILTETKACFLPGRAKDLSAPLYFNFLYDIILSTICSTILTTMYTIYTSNFTHL